MSHPADLGVLEAAAVLGRVRSRRASSSTPASHGSASATACTATTATRVPSTPGCACTRRTRSTRRRALMSGSQQAAHPSSVAFRSV